MRLLYKTYYVAEVEEEGRDFPDCFGRFQLAPDIASVAEGKIKEYVDYSIATWPLIEANRPDEIDFAHEEIRFGQLIDPSEWWLESGDQRVPILIPNFCTDGRINWRFDPGRRAEVTAEPNAAPNGAPAVSVDDSNAPRRSPSVS